jgi:hypothetical protein
VSSHLAAYAMLLTISVALDEVEATTSRERARRSWESCDERALAESGHSIE